MPPAPLGSALLAVRLLLGGSLCAYLVYACISVWAAMKWRRSAAAPPPDRTPAVSILKPVRGVDAEAYENFASFCRQDYPADRVQILFGALEADDPALELARRLQVEFPSHDIGVITAPPDATIGTNRKASNLLAMLPHARHDMLVLCDSDMRAQPDYLRRVVAPFVVDSSKRPATLEAQRHGGDTVHNPKSKSQDRVGLVTCPYRGGRAIGVASMLEALGIGADFIPSTLVSRALEGMTFALGSTIALPRAVLDEIGGFEALLNELADDYLLGSGVRRAGYAVVMSDYVIESVLGRERFSTMWARRLRWARTTRAYRPRGYAGLFVTHGLALALLFLCASGCSALGWAALAIVVLTRAATALMIALRCTGDRAVLRFLPLLPISDLLSAALYVASYLGRHVLWRGERFRLMPGGRLVRDDTP
ncbi:MAG TPA: glycosyltransferase [Chthonomonadaceae bacterium]|nr:glycosyltransferase [Chthonomonadaceae bacterium]